MPRHLLALFLTCAAQAAPLNCVLVMLDDWGADYYGKTNSAAGAHVVATPQIDALANQGVLMTRFFSNRACSPSRAALLSGRQYYRTGVTQNGGGTLAASEYTVADDFGAKGYATGIFGKWHQGSADGNNTPNTIGGFDRAECYSTLSNFGFAHWDFSVIVDGADAVQVTGKWIGTDTIDRVIAWTGSATEPWFAYVPMVPPHFQVGNGGGYPYPPASLRPGYPGTEGEDGQENGFRAMLQACDSEIGRLVSSLDLSDTLVVVLGDNGSPFVNPPTPDGDRIKAGKYRDSYRVPCIFAGAGVTAKGARSNVSGQIIDLYPTIVHHCSGSAHSSTNTIDGRDLSAVLRGETYPDEAQALEWEGDPLIATNGSHWLVDYQDATPDEFYALTTDPHCETDLGTGALTGADAVAYDECLNALATNTAKTLPAVETRKYGELGLTTGSTRATSGGVAVAHPATTTDATITADLYTDATTYTLWKRSLPAGTWEDSGETATVGANVSFTDSSPAGTVEYQITNDAAEPATPN